MNHMVNSRSAQLDETFFALSDPTRRLMIQRLASGEMSVRELSAPFKMSAPAISKHLKVLERAGLLARQRIGREKQCRLLPAPLQEAAEWVVTYKQFWSGQLDSLAEYLENQLPGEEPEQ